MHQSIERRKGSNDSTQSGQTIGETKISEESATSATSNEKQQNQEYPTFSSSCGTQTDLSHIHQVYIVPETISIYWLPSPILSQGIRSKDLCQMVTIRSSYV